MWRVGCRDKKKKTSLGTGFETLAVIFEQDGVRLV